SPAAWGEGPGGEGLARHRVADTLEETLLALWQGRSAHRRRELLQKFALLVGQRLRHHHRHADDHVAAAGAAQVGYALPADDEILAALRAGGNFARELAVQRRNLDLCAARGLRQVHRQCEHDVVLDPLEELVWLNVQRHEQVTRLAAAGARL